MHTSSKFRFQEFGASDDLATLRQTNQIIYLRQYLLALGVKRIVIEDGYFDRDYLSEFSAFYGQSARGYSNLCTRLSFFTDDGVDRTLFRRALQNRTPSLKRLQESFAGFAVIRPFEVAPLGRTVLAWFPEHNENRARVTRPSRDYAIHLGGVELIIKGLAWQQQDSAVGACATISLWTMFHASAFDDHHAIPTTAAITRSAHRTASLGARIFPSGGLNIHQLLEAIKEQDLSPGILNGDQAAEDSRDRRVWGGFSRERFCSGIAALIRSGYPVLLVGHHISGDGARNPGAGHAICAVGFRPGSVQPVPAGEVVFRETNLEHVYIHDDNIGPSARFEVISHPAPGAEDSVCLKHSRPSTAPQHPGISALTEQAIFVPEQAIIATHNEIRVSPDRLNQAALINGKRFARLIEVFHQALAEPLLDFGITVDTRYAKLADYLGDILKETFADEPERLGKTRLALCEQVPPMSLHIGIIRLSGSAKKPLMDILIDTSDNEHIACRSSWAHVSYDPFATHLIDKLAEFGEIVVNNLVKGY